MKSESDFSLAIASQPFKHFHMEKNWAQKYICGEKMTNIKSAAAMANTWSTSCSVQPLNRLCHEMRRWVELATVTLGIFLEWSSSPQKPWHPDIMITVKMSPIWINMLLLSVGSGNMRSYLLHQVSWNNELGATLSSSDKRYQWVQVHCFALYLGSSDAYLNGQLNKALKKS